MGPKAGFSRIVFWSRKIGPGFVRELFDLNQNPCDQSTTRPKPIDPKNQNQNFCFFLENFLYGGGKLKHLHRA